MARSSVSSLSKSKLLLIAGDDRDERKEKAQQRLAVLKQQDKNKGKELS